MKLLVTLRLAARALRRNKMRTILTMLGMIIGVGAVIVTVSLGNGAKAQVEAQIASLGQNVVLVFNGSFNRGGVRSGFGGAGTLTVDDAVALQREIPEIITISPERRYNAQIAAGDLNWSTSIIGESETYLDIRQWPLSQGAMFTEQDVHGANKVAIIGQTVATQLFPDGDAVGQAMRIKNVPFIVVGVLSPKGLSVQGQDQDDVVVLPYTSLMKRLQGVTTLSGVTVQAVSAAALSTVQDQIIAILRQRHRTNPLTDDFIVRTQEEITAAANNTSQTMRILLVAVAIVSLVVGGIGIMNIMLVSVTERTREIGIRMAVGAHGRDILTQFLTEAVTLSMLGGVLGITLGVVGSWLLTHFGQWPTLIPTFWIVISFIVSAVVGVFFGFYPAWKASQLDPIDALRYE
ncbi:MAG TPA: ABC transporter permease [Verrucomicrobiae bacterium]|jgi:putative ABC transport system permease protein|nr:ABC transporter permease [Verrucomicrobiae bacterium]